MTFEKQDNWEDVTPPYGQMELAWQKLSPPKGKLVFQTRVGVADACIRMNDFPDEPLYTLIVSGAEVIHFNDWPPKWRK